MLWPLQYPCGHIMKIWAFGSPFALTTAHRSTSTAPTYLSFLPHLCPLPVPPVYAKLQQSWKPKPAPQVTMPGMSWPVTGLSSAFKLFHVSSFFSAAGYRHTYPMWGMLFLQRPFHAILQAGAIYVIQHAQFGKGPSEWSQEWHPLVEWCKAASVERAPVSSCRKTQKVSGAIYTNCWAWWPLKSPQVWWGVEKAWASCLQLVSSVINPILPGLKQARTSRVAAGTHMWEGL